MAIEIIINIIEAMIVGLFINVMLCSKFRRVKQIVIYIAFVVVFASAVMIINRITDFETYESILYFAIIILYAQFFFVGKLQSKLFFSIIPLCVIIIASIITATVTPILFDSSMSSSLEVQSEIRLGALIFAKLTQLLLTFGTLSAFKRKFLNLKRIEWIGFISVFLLLCICGVAVFEIGIVLDSNLKTSTFAIVATSLVLINALMMVFYYSFSRKSERLIETKHSEEKLKYQINSAEEIQKAYYELRKLRHDLANQYSCVKKLISDKDYDVAERYLSDFSTEVEKEIEKNKYILTKCLPLNAVIHTLEVVLKKTYPLKMKSLILNMTE